MLLCSGNERRVGRRIGRNKPGQPTVEDHAANGVDIFIRQIWGNLDEDRLIDQSGDPLQKLSQTRRFLKRSEPGSIRRRDVDHKVVAEPLQARKQLLVVLLGFLYRRSPILADVDSDRDRSPARRFHLEAKPHRLHPSIVESHPILQRVGFRVPEQPRPRVSFLRSGRDRADLGKAEAQGRPGGKHGSVFVESCCQADRVGEIQPQDSLAETVVPDRKATSNRLSQRRSSAYQRQHAKRQRMGGFGLQSEEQRPERSVADRGGHSRAYELGRAFCYYPGRQGNRAPAHRPRRPLRISTMPESEVPSGSSPGHGRSLLASLPPGLLVGAHVAALLYFLNPELPFSLVSTIRAVTVYAAVLGSLSILLILPFTYSSSARAQRLLPWTLTICLALSAYFYWLQASYLSYYLDPGMSVRLIKAAIGLTVFALAGFYTALLHTIHRRPYGLRSRSLFVLLSLLSLVMVFERRGAFRIDPEALPRPAVVQPDPSSRLLVVGIDGATLDAVLPLASQGRLPAFASLMEDGAYGRLTGPAPARLSPLWTSVSTGRLPWEHRVLADDVYPANFLSSGALLRLTPVGMGFKTWGIFGSQPRPLDARYRQAPQAWEIYERLGVPSGVVGWPASHPAGDGAGYMFSDRFFSGEFTESTVRPSGLGERGTLFQIAPDEINPGQISAFGPDIPLPVLEVLAQDVWRESLTSFLLEQNRHVQAVFLMLPGLASVSQDYFGAFASFQFEGAQSDEINRGSEVLGAYYEHLDDYLGRLRQRMGPAETLAVTSAYGYDGFPAVWRGVRSMMGKDRLEGTKVLAPDGVLFIVGRGIKAGTFLSGVDIADVLPTLLYSTGLPIARNGRGRVLTEAFENSYLASSPLVFVPSYETLIPPTPDIGDLDSEPERELEAADQPDR